MQQQDLVVRAAAGDRDAFAALATSHIDRCYALAYRILRDQDRAQDASWRFWAHGETFRRSATRSDSMRGSIGYSSTPV